MVIDSGNANEDAEGAQKNHMFKKIDLINSPILIEKAKEELKFCIDRVITPAQII